MKIYPWRIVLAVAAAIAFIPATRGGDDFKLEPGFTSLFNGKDLTGWEYRVKKDKENLDGKTETSDKRIEVKDGIILVNAKDAKGKGGIKDMYTQKNFD